LTIFQSNPFEKKAEVQQQGSEPKLGAPQTSWTGFSHEKVVSWWLKPISKTWF
jgi:hypothetical protein